MGETSSLKMCIHFFFTPSDNCLFTLAKKKQNNHLHVQLFFLDQAETVDKFAMLRLHDDD